MTDRISIPVCENVDPDKLDLHLMAQHPEPEALDLAVQVALEKWTDQLQKHIPKARLRALAIVTVDEDGDVDFSIVDPLRSYRHEINSGAHMLGTYLSNVLTQMTMT